ncbi:MAG: hypothetical protein WBD81_19200, partial [Collimonas pratensis]|uniref:hypothetical protein n=1 Tax=Collimonas pratensis TaxID=279113 RepID=UPI003C7567A1
MNDVEVEYLFGVIIEADLPHALIGRGEKRGADFFDVVDRAGLLHRRDQHIDVILAGRRAERRLIVREVALV